MFAIVFYLFCSKIYRQLNKNNNFKPYHFSVNNNSKLLCKIIDEKKYCLNLSISKILETS